MRCSSFLFAAALFVCSLPVVASAHEFVVMPEAWDSYHAEQVVPLSVYSTPLLSH